MTKSPIYLKTDRSFKIFIYIFILHNFYCNCEFELNNILFFYKGTNYRGGSFATNRNGDIVIEYSSGLRRLFYGFKKDGSYFFNSTDYENIPSKIIDIDAKINATRFESRNLFIQTKSGNNKEYLLSTGTFSSTELMDLENNKYMVFNTTIMMGYTIFSKAFALLDLNTFNQKEYVCIFTNKKDYNIKLIKFSFNDLKEYNIIKEAKLENNYAFIRIVSSFVMNSSIIVFYINNNYECSFNLYDFDLNLISNNSFIAKQIDYNRYKNNLGYYFYEAGLFFKGILIQNNLVAFAYYKDCENIIIKIGNFKNDNNNYFFEILFNIDLYEYHFQATVTLNDLRKINDNRLILITSSPDYKILYILLFDMYNNYENIKIRIYNINLKKYKIIKELSLAIYNGFVIFSSTVLDLENENIRNEELIDTKCFSIFMMFGDISLKNSIIDISDFLPFNSTNNEKNLINGLLENAVIDNNIFGYENIEKIKLVSIPEVIIFFYNNTKKKLFNGDLLNSTYSFDYNLTSVNETDLVYYLEYQYMIKEPDYEKYNSFPINIINCSLTNSSPFIDQKEFYEPKLFYGKSNKAKLCIFHSCFIKSESESLCPKDFNYRIVDTNECIKSCSYKDLKTRYCSLISDKTIIIKELRNEIIKSYPINSNESLILMTNESFAFQVTTSSNEINSLKGIYSNEYNLSIIDIKNCENLLKKKNYLKENQDLIILKYEKITNNSNEKIVQYEVYHPEKKEKIDLFLCKDIKIDIFMPSTVNESILYKYNESSEYYNDLCYPSTTEYNTDIILEDRIDEYINNNMSLCETNCDYKGYDSEKKIVQCKCEIKIAFSLILDLEIDKKVLYNKFIINFKKITNFYVIKCYKLLLCKEGIINNIGSYVILVIIFIDIILTIIFVVKGHNELIQKIQKINLNIINNMKSKKKRRKIKKKRAKKIRFQN